MIGIPWKEIAQHGPAALIETVALICLFTASPKMVSSGKAGDKDRKFIWVSCLAVVVLSLLLICRI